MGTKNNPGKFDCYEAAEDDEPMFVLLARDVSAPEIVEAWANARVRLIHAGAKPQSHHEKIAEARACADAMREWYRQTQTETTT